jgi:hypothetical protein
VPLGDATYETVIYATGVIDFTSDQNAIRGMLSEGRRVLKQGGKIFVAFYRSSPTLEYFLQRLGLLNNHVLRQRDCLETCLLTPPQMIRWMAKRARIGRLAAAALMLRLVVSGTLREKMTSLKMQRIVRGMDNPQAFIQAAPETIPYRNEEEIRTLFNRLAIPIKELRTLATCWIAQI